MAFFKKRSAAKRRKRKESADREADKLYQQGDESAEGMASLRDDTEVWLTHQGLPHLIDHYSIKHDIFTRMAPFLVFAFFVEIGFGFGSRFNGLVRLEIVGLFFLAAIAGAVTLNLARDRHFFALPKRIGVLEITIFILCPALLSMFSSERLLYTFILIAVFNIILVGGSFVLTSYGVIPMLVWTLGFMRKQSSEMVRLIAGSLPMSLLFAGFFFLNTEMWQIAADYTPLFYAINVGMILVSGLIFISSRIPQEVMSLERFNSWEEVREIVARTDSPLADVEIDKETSKEEFVGVPLSRGATSNIELLLLISQVVRFLMAGLVIGAFFFLLGIFAIRRVVIEQWLRYEHISEIWSGDIFGGEVMITWQLVVVSGFIASFSSLQFVVRTMTDQDYRGRFFEDMEAELREILAVRRQYLTLPEPQDEN